MDMWRYPMVILIAAVTATSAAEPKPATTRAATQSTTSHAPADARAVVFVVTWAAYDGGAGAEEADVIVNGEIIGVGRTGLIALIGLARKAPRGSEVILTWREPLHQNGGNGYRPLDEALEMSELIDWCAEDHGLKVERRPIKQSGDAQ